MKLRPHQARILDAMNQHDKGVIVVPTGGGKTLIMIMNLLQRFVQNPGQVAVVVAPRILLAEQLSAEFLEFITSANVLHVHSGETHHTKTTKSEKIADWVTQHADTNRIIFTTYNSLGRVVDAGVNVDVAYFDEAHNSTQKNHFIAVAATSMSADSISLLLLPNITAILMLTA
jgi:superfamily II DNA or RNA helicase